VRALAVHASLSQQKILIVSDPRIKLFLSDIANIEFVPFRKGLIQLIATAVKISPYSFEATFNLSYLLRPAHLILGFIAKSPKKISFKLSNPSGQNVWEEIASTDLNRDPMWQRYLELLKRIGLAMDSYQYDIGLSDRAKSPLKKKGTLINVFGASCERSFNQSGLSFLINKWKSKGPIYLIAEPSKREELSSFLRQLSNDESVKLCPKLELFELIKWASQFENLITPDTSWVHIGCALKLNVVCYYLNDESQIEKNSLIWAPHGTHFEQYLLPKIRQDESIRGISEADIVNAKKM
jgi:ADP-heptose:LPS heptosyltransferase